LVVAAIERYSFPVHVPPLLTTITLAFSAAWVFGLLTQRLRLSPLVGYLIGGMLVGPYTPGFVGNVEIATQLSELGVILLMFGVGLHFHAKDLLAVRNVAIPGAIGQSLVATLLGVGVALLFGMPFKTGLVLGMAMAVASTVVLVRVLTDNKSIDTPHGHVAIGWLIVEDILTVIVLVLIPALGTPAGSAAHGPPPSIWVALPVAMLKLAVMVVLLMVIGAKVIPWIMVKVARLRSRELFTLTVLVMAITIATGSAVVFGASMALGAFLAGMVVGQSPVSQQAAADALPLRDAFAVLFFAAVGMLFDPMFVVHRPLLTLGCLAVVMIGKPLAALVIVTALGHPLRTAMTVAVGLAQIGEFSFILSDLAHDHGLLGDDGHHVLVACAIISITLNPLLFRMIPAMEKGLARSGRLWRLLNRHAAEREQRVNQDALERIETGNTPLAVILGYGPVGQTVDSLLRRDKVDTVIVDMNLDTIQQLKADGREAIYGDAYNISVMGPALERATHVIITIPHATNREALIVAAKLINPAVKVFVRAHYLSEGADLARVGADGICYEEAEAAAGLSRLVLLDRGLDREAVRRETSIVRKHFYEGTLPFIGHDPGESPAT
jgi:CPA2 family monovalent cation:H+ antiporter-2